MLKILISLSLVALFSSPTSANSGENKIANLFKTNTQNESTVLSNGVNVALPVHYFQIAALVTLGTVDLEKTQLLMKGTGLYPVPVSSKKGLAIIYMVDHTANTIGNYREFVTLVAATNDPKFAANNWKGKLHAYRQVMSAFFPNYGDREARSNKNFFFYVPFITVTSDDALLAGREIWNLPKHLAQFDLNYYGTRNSAAMKSTGCAMEFYQGERQSQLKLPLYMDFNLVGFWNNEYSKLVKSPMLAHGTGYVSLFNSKLGDSFSVDKKTECGKWITEAGYKPLAWQYVPRSGAILFKHTTEPHQPNEAGELAESTKILSEQFIQELARTSN